MIWFCLCKILSCSVCSGAGVGGDPRPPSSKTPKQLPVSHFLGAGGMREGPEWGLVFESCTPPPDMGLCARRRRRKMKKLS